MQDGIHKVSTDVKPDIDAVWGPQIGPQAAEIPVVIGSLTVRPDFHTEPRISPNTGENPRKRWDSRDGIRSCSRLFVGLETAKGPQGARKGTAKGPQPPASVCASYAVAYSRDRLVVLPGCLMLPTTVGETSGPYVI